MECHSGILKWKNHIFLFLSFQLFKPLVEDSHLKQSSCEWVIWWEIKSFFKAVVFTPNILRNPSVEVQSIDSMLLDTSSGIISWVEAIIMFRAKEMFSICLSSLVLLSLLSVCSYLSDHICIAKTNILLLNVLFSTVWVIFNKNALCV